MNPNSANVNTTPAIMPMSVLCLPPNPFPHRIIPGPWPCRTHRTTLSRSQCPQANQKSRPNRRQQKHRHRCDPRDVIESPADRSREHRSPILRRKPVEDRSIRPSPIDLRMQLPNHYRRNRAAHVIALQKHLPASAGADHLMTHLLEPRIRRRPQHHHRQQTNHPSSREASKPAVQRGTHATKWPPSAQELRPEGHVLGVSLKHDEPQLRSPASPLQPVQPSASDSAPAPGTSPPPQSAPQSRSSSSADSKTP